MKKILLSILLIATLVLSACVEGDDNGDGNGNGEKPEEKVYYTNPVFEPVFADPTMIRGDDGIFYAYGTSDYSDWGGELTTRLIPIISSPDMVNWTFEGSVFDSSNRPMWRPTNFGIWAPDIIKIGDTYNLYYSFAGWADKINSAVGVATAPHPLGPWTDHGPVVTTQNTGVLQSIDSFTFIFEEKVYIIWGSYYGMYYIELADDGLSIKAGAEAVQIGGSKNPDGSGFSTYEAANLIKQGDYWYLLVSHGNCCEGLNTNYYVTAFRAESPLGPYYSDDGKPMLGTKNETGQGANVVRNNAFFVGTGHNATIQDDNGDYWLVYHGYDTSMPGTENGVNRRALLIDKIIWTDGWPYLKDYGASYRQTEAPYIKE